MTFTIRQATPDDLEQIIGLFKHGFAPAVQPILIEDIQGAFEGNSCIPFVAATDGTIIGHARIRYINPDKAHFGSLVVNEAYRNRGVATALSKARVAYLKEHNFQGIAYSDAVTLHPYSQQQLFAVGFSPIRILPGSFPDHGAGLETNIGFVQIFSPVELWKPESTELSLYLAPEYRAIATETLNHFGVVAFKETTTESPGERTKSFVVSENPEKIYAVRLYEPAAPAEISLLRSKGCIIAGFTPVIKDGQLSAVAHMYRAPDIVLNRNKIKVIPAAERLFDFVWEQYASVR